MDQNKIKRVYCYAKQPQEFEAVCPKCEGMNLAWSEYQNHIWCYDCEEDLDNYSSVLSGPVPIQTAEMMGMRFDQIHIETGEYYVFLSRINVFANYKRCQGLISETRE